MTYLLYIPQTQPDELLPLVLFLHGGGEGGNDIEKVKKHGPPKLIAEGQSFPFIVVSPQNPSESQFWDDQQLVRLLDEVQAELPVDPTRIYLTGLSRGGYGAWRLAVQNADRFAALVPICGGGPAPYARKLKDVPTWVFHGAKDSVIPLNESQRMVDALTKAGGNVRFTIYPDAQHDAWTETYDNPELYEWMLNQRRGALAAVNAADSVEPIYPLHTVTLSFEGPDVSESDETNPFTDYRLQVTFRQREESIVIRGFYAADGNAAHTHADHGNVWQVRFSPPTAGRWSYSAKLRRGSEIAIDDDSTEGTVVALREPTGTFEVTPLPIQPEGTRDLRKMPGVLIADDHYYRFGMAGPRVLKVGANSPENLLAYADFDGTFRIEPNQRDGEARTTETLHQYGPHLKDWRNGDPNWANGKGKSLIGAMNYLASSGMNSVYFLTMNIGGDGKDVWPYASPDDFTRFDCSKLDQWEILFEHMQQQGLILHVITQETENETLLDSGDVGRLRKLYYRELIARFAHHPGLIWNLGEENGPAPFSPNGQTTQQQMAMTDYLAQHDPYGHPILIHTHASQEHQESVLAPLLGHLDAKPAFRIRSAALPTFMTGLPIGDDAAPHQSIHGS